MAARDLLQSLKLMGQSQPKSLLQVSRRFQRSGMELLDGVEVQKKQNRRRNK